MGTYKHVKLVFIDLIKIMVITSRNLVLLLIRVITLLLNVINEEIPWASSIRKFRVSCGQALLPWE